MKNLLQFLWQCSALSAIYSFLNDDSSRVISDAGVRYLQTHTRAQVDELVKQSQQC